MPAPSPLAVERRIRAVLDRLDGGGGEALAALAALRRLMPPGSSLGDVLLVGLHYACRDLADPSLVAENRRLAERTVGLSRRGERLTARVGELESAIAAAIQALENEKKYF